MQRHWYRSKLYNKQGWISYAPTLHYHSSVPPHPHPTNTFISWIYLLIYLSIPIHQYIINTSSIHHLSIPTHLSPELVFSMLLTLKQFIASLSLRYLFRQFSKEELKSHMSCFYNKFNLLLLKLSFICCSL